MKNKTLVSIAGLGNVGLAVAERLNNLGFEIDFVALGKTQKTIETSFGKEIAVVEMDDYRQVISNEEFDADYIVVCVAGDVLEEHLDTLFLSKKPLIILSTKYDERAVVDKCLNYGYPVILSPNMALPVLDFWKRLKTLNKSDYVEIVEATESHPGFKKDVSGTLVNTLDICNSVGIGADFDIRDAKREYKEHKNAKVGCVTWIRNPDTQKQQFNDFMKDEFVEAHAYHEYLFEGNHTPAAKSYLDDMYYLLEDLEDHSNENLAFSVSISEDLNSLKVRHYINGRTIYGDGVAECIAFIEEGNNIVYSGIDVVS